MAGAAAFIRLHQRLGAGLLCHDLPVKQAKTALNQFLAPRDEVYGWCLIDVIKRSLLTIPRPSSLGSWSYMVEKLELKCGTNVR